MNIVKNFTVVFLLIFISACGFKPLVEKNKINFYISDINFEGDRKINNYIERNLKRYREPNTNLNGYKLLIFSQYSKNLTNKDKDGNPKNYNLKLIINAKIISSDGTEISKSFERSTSMNSQSSKIKEKEIEKNNKKNLSNLLSEDLIFFLLTKK